MSKLLAELTVLPETGKGGQFTTEHGPPYGIQDKATLHCKEGYKLPNETVSTVLFKHGDLAWEPAKLYCQPVSELNTLPETGEGGSLKVSRNAPPYHPGDTAELTCKAGYRHPTQKKSIVVLENGRLIWKPATLFCTAVRCPTPFIPVYGKVTDTQYRYPHHFKYECREGYRLNRPVKSYHCMANGKWMPTPPSNVACLQVKCPLLQAPLNGSMSTYTQSFGSMVTFQCDPDYTLLQGETTRRCQGDGTWSGANVVCGKVPCPPIDHSIVKLVDMDQSVVVHCDHGRTVRVRCLPTGEWTLPPPFCQVLPPVSSPAAVPVVAPSPAAPAPKTRATKLSKRSLVWVWMLILVILGMGLWNWRRRATF